VSPKSIGTIWGGKLLRPDMGGLQPEYTQVQLCCTKPWGWPDPGPRHHLWPGRTKVPGTTSHSVAAASGVKQRCWGGAAAAVAQGGEAGGDRQEGGRGWKRRAGTLEGEENARGALTNGKGN